VVVLLAATAVTVTQTVTVGSSAALSSSPTDLLTLPSLFVDAQGNPIAAAAVATGAFHSLPLSFLPLTSIFTRLQAPLSTPLK
jgi:hypothetical protein